jgi:hypothetical protein
MVVNKLRANASLLSIDVIKLAVFEMGCVEDESPAMLRIAEDARGSGSHLPR